MRHVRLARLGWIGLFLIAGAVSGCDRASKLGPPSIATALRLAKDDLDLPDAANVDPEPDTPVTHVVVSRSRVSILGDPWPIAKIPTDPALGLAADDKRYGRSGLRITPLAQTLVWLGEHNPAYDGGSGPDWDPRKIALELENPPLIIVVADAKTTYRIVAEVAASAPNMSRVALAARTGDRAKPVGIVPLALPYRSGSAAATGHFEMRFGATGLTITFAKHSIGAGCSDVGAGPAVPREASRAFDFGAFTTCLGRLGTALKEVKRLQDEHVGLGADPETDLATLTKLLDALRAAHLTDIELLAPGASPPR